ncbi:MAG TPA: hypothetical protein VHA35_12985 [Dongiaceae bacterium]|nr:hypothetical protein [Dongiaceae bacterium]
MDRQRLDAAVEAGIITPEQAARLAAFFAGDASVPFDAPTRFDVSHLLWYAGALIVIGAMTIFSAIAFRQAGPQALTWTAIAYAAGFVVMGRHFWNRPGLRTPGGLLIACAVAMAPLAIYGIQGQLGVWPDLANSRADYPGFLAWLNASWVYMSLGAILAGIVALAFFPFPFIIVILAVAAWLLALDLVPWLLPARAGDRDLQSTICFGLAAIALAWILDLRRWRDGDFPFWLHIVGIAALWGGVTAQESRDEVAKALYALLNVGFLVLSVYLMRRVYAAFGALGISLYLGHLAADVFEDSLLFPLALSAIGLAVIGIGIWYFRRRQAVADWLARVLPPGLQRLRPVHAREGEQ